MMSIVFHVERIYSPDLVLFHVEQLQVVNLWIPLKRTRKIWMGQNLVRFSLSQPKNDAEHGLFPTYYSKGSCQQNTGVTTRYRNRFLPFALWNQRNGIPDLRVADHNRQPATRLHQSARQWQRSFKLLHGPHDYQTGSLGVLFRPMAEHSYILQIQGTYDLIQERGLLSAGFNQRNRSLRRKHCHRQTGKAGARSKIGDRDFACAGEQRLRGEKRFAKMTRDYLLRIANRRQVDLGIPLLQKIDVCQCIGELLRGELSKRTQQRRNLLDIHS